jgi:hypothetical protein
MYLRIVDSLVTKLRAIAIQNMETANMQFEQRFARGVISVSQPNSGEKYQNVKPTKIDAIFLFIPEGRRLPLCRTL